MEMSTRYLPLRIDIAFPLFLGLYIITMFTQIRNDITYLRNVFEYKIGSLETAISLNDNEDMSTLPYGK